ncbi:MAG: acyl-ACP--UDP-N-acetylglucosamine O-acyltransferase [Paludibacteraceae bacterium]|nr:acyl-ACP--UDP-N-acetylglucosamine O-acyltransferase [Paludibacteraceae bacterium]MBO7337521.1 acyl-ACP--UDP-N-acetylglucosamine O-acyltransferase [Paludibacteraceae bacterium]MBP5136696.1 acyl-ACP--UDP-N-acetylglucosamine O-acyltransferase [Paludibacteraceae bacterium]MBP5742419.1 acyl-ACP--UDP-N-acetylglucosamine O-acyltransferase [Paludibacteraceae bacterium]
MDYPLSQVSPKAKIGKNVKIGPFVTIADDVVIGDGTEIMSNAVILDGARIGKDCLICTGAVISNIPQDLKFKGEKTTAVIGDRTTIREYVTVNRGTASKNTTIIGDDCLIMAYCHVAHDCKLGNHIITSNACQIAGEVVIEDYATIGGGTLIHQFTHIGTQVMMQGGSRAPKDIPPYAMVGREPLRFIGINSVGLKRRGFTNEQIDAIQRTYRLIYQPGLNFSQAIELAEKEVPECVEKRTIIDFIKSSSRGIINN